MIFVDIETDNLNPYSVQKISCMVTLKDDTYKHWHDEPEAAYRDGSIADGITYLNSANETLAGHNIHLYDYPVLRRFGLNEMKIVDTLLASRLLFPLGGKPMKPYIHPDTVDNKEAFIKQAMQRQYDEDDDEEDKQYFVSHGLEKWGQRLGVNKGEVSKDFTTVRPALLEYCQRDVYITKLIYDKASERLNELDDTEYSDYQRLTEFNSRVAEVTRVMCSNGVTLDSEALSDILTELDVILESLLIELKGVFGEEQVTLVHKPTKKNPDRILPEVKEFNPGSDQMLAKAMDTKHPGWEPAAFTESGKPSFALKNIEPLFAQYPALELVASFRDLRKRKSAIVGDGVPLSGSGYLNNLVNGRIHGTINCIGARTWRATHALPNLGQTTSAKKSYGSDIRKAFVVPNGFKFVGFDISNLEVGTIAEVVARVTGHQTLMNQVLRGNKEDGTDTHSLNAASLSKHFNTNVSRDMAKTLFFAFLYGAGATKLGSYLTISKEKDVKISIGNDIIKTFGRTCPGLIETREYFITEYLLNGFVTLPDGHKVVANSAHACLNMIGQGLGAIISKYILVAVYDVILKSGLCPKTEVMPILWVHDEMHFQVREDLADEFVSIIPDICKKSCDLLELTFPIVVEVKQGKSWLDTH